MILVEIAIAIITSLSPLYKYIGFNLFRYPYDIPTMLTGVVCDYIFPNIQRIYKYFTYL